MNPPDSTLTRIIEALRPHDRFVIMSHMRPDGDALGTIIALGMALRQLG